MAPIPAKEGNLEGGNESQSRCAKTVIRTQQIHPPFQGLTCWRRPRKSLANDAPDLGQPGCEPLPIELEQRQQPDDIITPRTSADKSFNGAVLNQPIRLGKGRKNTKGLAAKAAAEAPDQDAEKSKLETADISSVVPECPKGVCASAMRTMRRWWQAPLKAFLGVTLHIAWNGADYLHPLDLLNRAYGGGQSHFGIILA